jgi:hypothetical protein
VEPLRAANRRTQQSEERRLDHVERQWSYRERERRLRQRQRRQRQQVFVDVSRSIATVGMVGGNGSLATVGTRFDDPGRVTYQSSQSEISPLQSRREKAITMPSEPALEMLRPEGNERHCAVCGRQARFINPYPQVSPRTIARELELISTT